MLSPKNKKRKAEKKQDRKYKAPSSPEHAPSSPQAPDFFFHSSALTLWATATMAFMSVWFPLSYIADIVKDSAQLILCVMVVDGLNNAFKNWLSFSSVVSSKRVYIPNLCFFITILITYSLILTTYR